MISAPFQGTYQQANSFEYQNQTKSSLDNRFLHQDGKDYPTNYDDQFFDQWLSSQLATDEFASQSPHDHLSPAAAMQSNVPPSLHFTGGNGRNTHQRESSLSSLGSMGPASPYTYNTTNPQIAITDSSVENFHNMQNGDMNGQATVAYYPMGKSMEQFNGYQAFDPSIPDMAYPIAVQGPNKPRNDRGLLPAPEVAGMRHRSRPTSVTSSNGGDSPATPNMGEPEQTDNRRRAYGNVPKFDRTMTDVYSDELYSPNFTIISSSPTQSHTATSPGNHMFTQRLNAANSQHSDYQHQMRRVQSQQQNTDTPKTISPKDAMLDFNEPDGNQNFSLFPQGSNANFDFDPLAKMMSNDEEAARQFELLRPSGEQQHAYTQLSMDSRIPQQYPFVPRLSGSENVSNGRLESAQAAPAEHDAAPLRRGRPTSTAADGGTYTCTYHGCSMRFETPSQLQKHKREGHRQMPLGLKSQETTSLSTAANTQAGPHRCDRINPSTGKPCNSIFSRPYDLTRHEDTIHNARKLKVRCDICTEEKTFSRADALTRHYRVCHPEMELPGKHRRRAT